MSSLGFLASLFLSIEIFLIKSFKLPKWLEYFFAYCGTLALQGNAIEWVSTHRYHHQFVDSEKDPHSQIEGFWFSHMTWLFDTDQRNRERNNAKDLEKQPFYKFLEKTYILHQLALGALLYALGLATHIKLSTPAQKQKMAFARLSL
ncbi:hypothetical protein SASPL_118822 [Salvia splendens]|uniref:Stearoyl-CoA desaturase (Delta-9 desaturase) n=1 Tax=Salvia splendens TaxID=180675 RepID=A0A8X8Y144_SALSN|nr:hypothetical protein SASPL_118822 [Salvia splendens]